MEHDGCKLCKYENCSMESKECIGCKQNSVDKYKRMTQADRIRSMSDEELAEFIVGLNDHCLAGVGGWRMSKAVLVMDMPESCMGCNFMYCDILGNTESCQAKETARTIDLEKYDKPDWCPLRPMPEKRECNGLLDFDDSVSYGFNLCIDAIGGGDCD